MVTVLDVAAYILKKAGTTNAMKLQKLVYYCQAWALVWIDKPLFRDRIEAWAYGPVAPKLYQAHRGQLDVSVGDIAGDPDALDKSQRKVVDAVLKYYGDKSAQWLSDLTHREDPWRLTRALHKLADGERGNAEITVVSLAEYYTSLQ